MIRALLIIITTLYSVSVEATSEMKVGLQIDADVWSSRDRTSLIRGAESVPQAIRTAVGPISLDRARGRCPFAMGAYNRTCPTYASDEGRAFLIYEPLPIQGQGPPTRLRDLNPRELRDLLLRRAVVHAFIAAADKRWEWSAEPRWRRLNFWRAGTEQAFNRDPWGYSRYLGMRSAHLDLVTFAEEYFVRPEVVLAESGSADAPARLQAFERDLAVQCQEFSRLRFLQEKVGSVSPGWREPLGATEMGCPAFDAWARIDALEGIDVLLAAATADRPQSLWGHLLIHIRHHDRVEGFQPVYQFGAVVSSDIDPVEYVTRGLMGGYHAVLDPYDYREIDRAVLRTEQRSLKRYRLQLTDRQTLHVLQRMWEMERRVRLPYWFFDENCAAFLADLLQSALPNLDVGSRSDFIVAPTDVLDQLASVQNPPLGALLVKLAEESLSNRERARWARARRDDVLEELDEHLGTSGLEPAAVGLRATDPAVRARSYQAIATLLTTAVSKSNADKSDRLRALSARLLRYNVEVERYYLESKITQANEVWARARRDVSPITATNLLARRRGLYLHEDQERRRAQRLSWDIDELEEFRVARRRELRRSEQRVVDDQAASREAFDVAVNVRREFYGAHGVAADVVEDEAWAELREHRARVDERSLGRSGKERAHVGVSTRRQRDETVLAVSLGFAFLDEKLGSQRTRGFRPDIETKVFDVRLDIPVVTDTHRPFVDLILLRYLSIEQLLRPARRSWLDVFGYGFDINMKSDPAIGVDWAVQGSGGLLLPIAKSAEFTSHLVFGLFPTMHYLTGHDDDRTMGGVWLFARAQAHLFGNFANVLRVELSGSPLIDLASFEPASQLAATSSVELYLGDLAQRPVLLVPHMSAKRTGVRLTGGAGDLSWVAGLRLESAL